MLVTGIRQTFNPAKTNENICNYDKLQILSSVVIGIDNSKRTIEHPKASDFETIEIAKILHRCNYVPDENEVWIAIDYLTGEIKVSGEDANNVLSMFDNPNKQVQSLDDLINNYKNEPKVEEQNKKKQKKKGRDDYELG